MPETEKRSKVDYQWLKDDETEPILPDRKCKYEYKSKGWKYYLLIQPDLQDWWDEFNGKQNKKGKLYYRNLDQFIRAKTSDREKRHWLFEMLGPKPEGFGKKRLHVPWLGDWYRRRKNNSWSIENKIILKSLRKSLESTNDSIETVKACAPFLVQEMLQYEKIRERINSEFCNDPFMKDEHVTSSKSLHRFKTYMNMLDLVTKKKVHLIREWMRVNGIDPQNPHEMWDMTTLAMLTAQSGAAGALSGYMVGQNMPLPGQVMSPFATSPTIGPSKTSMLLAQHLEEHAKTFKKPLKSFDDTDEVEVKAIVKEVKEKDKANGKSNGKHVV